MKKKSTLYILCITLLLSGGALHAREGLSVSFGAAYNHNGAQLDDFIKKGGVENDPDTTYKPCLLQVIPSIRTLKRWETTNHPDATVDRAIYDLETNGSMKGINMGASLRYDFLKRFFIRSGVEYEFSVMGGESRWKFNNLFFTGNPFPGQGPFAGAKASQKYSYEYLVIPVTIGINIPLRFRSRPEYNIYAGVGASFVNGGWSLEYNVPAYYFISWNNYSIKENLEFSISGFGINWVMGADVEIVRNFFIFIEMNGLYMEEVYASSKISDFYMQQSIHGNVPSADKLELPVNLSYTVIRVGVTVKLF